MTGSVVGRIIDAGIDFMGRWAYQIWACRHRTLTIISVYQVCAQSLHIASPTGLQVRSFTASAQQNSILRQHDRYVTPRAAFVTDLSKFLQQRRASGSGILLFGDINKPLAPKVSEMTKLCSDFGLLDLIHQLVGFDGFVTYVGGTSRIDYILCDDWPAQSAVSGGYKPFKFREKGDHRAMVVDFDSHMLFGNVTHTLTTIPQREFSSKDCGANRQYICSKYLYLATHNFAQQLATVQQHWSPDAATSLDQDFQRASAHAIQTCKRKPPVAFVQQLATLQQRKNLLLHAISQYKLGRPFQAAMNCIHEANPHILIPPTLEECQQQCWQCQQVIRTMEHSAVSLRCTAQQQQYRQAILQQDRSTARALKHCMAAKRT